MATLTPNLASVISIGPNGAVKVWWDGHIHDNLITFDQAGYKLMFNSYGGNLSLSPDVVNQNIKIYLNDLLALERYDFRERGGIHLDEPKVKALLKIK